MDERSPFLGPAAVAETHSATVFFFGDRAYKVRKPVDLGFLDFRTREARLADCRREVALNSRLAPDVYLGVADVLDVHGEPCDHLVVMRRLPADRRLATLVEQGTDVRDPLRAVAHQVAALHARSARSALADELAGHEATRQRWHTNTERLLAVCPPTLSTGKVIHLQDLADRYLVGRRPLLERRVAEGKAVDGHGDLLADDVFCLDDGPRVLDCLQFDERLRLGDGLADVAFLAMDLERLGRPDLGAELLATYAELRPDHWPPSLAHHHVAYRAQVRVLAAALRHQQGDAAAAVAAGELLDLATRHLDAGRVRLVVVGGLPGTGKSTVAAGLGVALDATVLRSDEVRKELAGVRWDEQDEGLYAPGAKARTYEVLLQRAEAALVHGESVVLDATWGSASERGQVRALAARVAADLQEVRCAAPADLAADRMRRRAARGGDPSDATPAVAAALAAEADPWPEAATLDTTGTPDRTVAAAVALVQA